MDNSRIQRRHRLFIGSGLEKTEPESVTRSGEWKEKLWCTFHFVNEELSPTLNFLVFLSIKQHLRLSIFIHLSFLLFGFSSGLLFSSLLPYSYLIIPAY